MLQQPNKKIVEQLLDSVVNIAEKDFPDKWQGLIKELLQYIDLTLSNTGTNLIVLKLFKRIIAKYEWSMRSDPLYEEIILVCNESHDAMMQLTKNTIDFVSSSQNVDNQ